MKRPNLVLAKHKFLISNVVPWVHKEKYRIHQNENKKYIFKIFIYEILNFDLFKIL